MEFTLTEEQKDFQKMARDFADKEILPRARELDEQEEFPHDIYGKMESLGIANCKELLLIQ